MVAGVVTTLVGSHPYWKSRAIAGMEPFAGLTGLTSFIGSGYALKESMVLRVAGKRIVTAFP